MISIFPLDKYERNILTLTVHVLQALSLFVVGSFLYYLYKQELPSFLPEQWSSDGWGAVDVGKDTFYYALILLLALMATQVHGIQNIGEFCSNWMAALLTKVVLPAALLFFAYEHFREWGKWWALAATGGVALIIAFIATLASDLVSAPYNRHIRGTLLAKKKPKQKRNRYSPYAGRVWWGGGLTYVEMPHFLVTGTTGSGKTVTINMLLKSVLESTQHVPRMLMFDSKLDVYQNVVGLGVPESHIAILNPFDARSVPWDISSDITKEDDATTVAALMLPSASEAKDPFWNNSARGVLAGVLYGLHRTQPNEWDLFDVCQAICHPKAVRELLEKTSFGKARLENFLQIVSETSDGITSNVFAGVQHFTTPAKLWRQARLESKDPSYRGISLKQWATNGAGVLLMAFDDERAEALGHLNRAMFQLLTKFLTSRPDVGPQNEWTDTTWIIADEVGSAKKLEGMDALLTKGRSKGVHVVLGFQHVEHLHVHYTEKGADTIIDQCENVALLRLTSGPSAEWASRRVGEKEFWQSSNSFAPNGGIFGLGQNTINTGIQKSRAILPEDFALFPVSGRRNGQTGVYGTPTDGFWKNKTKWKTVLKNLPRTVDVPGFIEREVQDTDLLAWKEEDFLRFGLTDKAEREQTNDEQKPKGSQGPRGLRFFDDEPPEEQGAAQ